MTKIKTSKVLFGVLFVLSIFILGVILSGCSSSSNINCSKYNTLYKKYRYDPQSESCVVYKTIQKDVCGNGIAEPGETYCNCPQDVPRNDPKYGCFGNKGMYAHKMCDNATETCKLFDTSNVTTLMKEIDLSNGDLTLDLLIKYNSPMVLNTANRDHFNINVSLFKIAQRTKISNLVVKSIVIKNYKNFIIARADGNYHLSNIGSSFVVNLYPVNTTKYMTDEYGTIEIVLEYDVQHYNYDGKIVDSTNNYITTLHANFGDFKIVNPKYYSSKNSYNYN